uniref:Mitochondrial carrier protein n=1 Tax=Odontella aurita TaxID=265563 RepID=A0A7S4M9V5_9STRA|mmetsp:Transcript_15262/g.44296  ORF Transcript_15262/g.44296 Transcript_15262/m.44296 type:complete len:295 (+) Transcript_15262:385-1269(+)
MSVAREMMSAGPGCAVANGLLNSLETTKVKLQLHSSSAPVYARPTTFGVMTQIAREEGVVRGLMTPGLSASLTRSMLHGAYRVGLYATARDFLAGGGGGEPGLAHRMASGMLTGGLGSMLSCPLDVVRTRMQADSGRVGSDGRYATGLRRGLAVRYLGMMDCFVNILRDEGLRTGLYRGASVTVARASLLNGSQLASYDTLKRFLQWEEGPVLYLTCALASGIIAQTVVMPVDTIKSYMMLGNDWRAVWNIMKTNGPFWFYRGYLPACAGQGMIMVLQMPLIEEFRRVLGVKAI